MKIHPLGYNGRGDVAKDGSGDFTIEEMIEMAQREPMHFSPSVVLRSVVQDHLLPTVCYFGGAAEVAYFAQSGEVYRLLGRPATPIIHRQSLTMIESRHRRTLERYGLKITDLFAGKDAVLSRIVDEHLNTGTAALIANVEEKINIEMISTSEIKISCIVRREDCEEAVRVLHAAFNLARSA